MLGLHAAGFFLLIAVVAPHGYELGATGVFGVGLGITAYTLGLRHAFDADHIAAIDNTTRKLMGEGQRPLSVGFFFSLGHSTIVFALGVLVVVGVRGLSGAVEDDGSALHQATGLIGPLVSGTFLLVIGLLNLVILVSIVRIFRRMRRGDFDEAELEAELDHRGLMTRFYARATARRAQAVAHVPARLPVRARASTPRPRSRCSCWPGPARPAGCRSTRSCACRSCSPPGMSLFDTIDGAFMNFAYGWAFSKPVRKIFYNLAITGLSVAVALLIGAIELLAVLAEQLSLSGGLWDVVAGIDLNLVGYLIVGLFVADLGARARRSGASAASRSAGRRELQ